MREGGIKPSLLRRSTTGVPRKQTVLRVLISPSEVIKRRKLISWSNFVYEGKIHEEGITSLAYPWSQNFPKLS